MAEAVAYAVAYLGTAAGVSAAVVSTWVAAVLVAAPYVTLLGTLAFSASQKRKGEKSKRDQYNAAQVDRLANVGTTVRPRTLVLGRARVGGHVFFRGSVGQLKEKFVMCIALAAHEIDAVEAIYLNDVRVTLDAEGYVVNEPWRRETRSSGQTRNAAPPSNAIPESITYYEGGGGDDSESYYVYNYQTLDVRRFARVRWYTGAADQVADPLLQSYFPGTWTADHRARSVAYLIVEMDYDETAFASGIPNVSAVVRGARVHDPRTGVTAWSENPALLARHVLLHPQFGKRTSLTATEDARLVAAANACDVVYDYGGGVVPMYRGACVFEFGTAARDVLDDLVQAMGGQWAYAAGEFHVRAGTYTGSVMSLSDADLAVVTRDSGGGESQQAITIATHRARNEKINVVKPRIWDAAQDYIEADLTPLKVAAYIAKDGTEIVQEVPMPAVFDARQALHIAGVLMRDARDPLTVTLPFKLTAYPLELFDTVSLTLARFGWSAKQFTVMGRSWSQDGRVMLTLKETSAQIYQPDGSFPVQGAAANTALPRPWDIAPPSIVTITSGTSELLLAADGTVTTRVRVQWDPVTDASVLSGQVEVQWRAADAAAWSGLSVSGSETQAYLLGAQDGTAIVIRARARNSVAVSDWGLQRQHQVVGKTEPPPGVEVFTLDGDTLRWTPVQALDLAGYLIRFNYGNNTFWQSAALIHEGFITDSPYTLVTRPAGIVTLMIKAVDTSGNESAAAAVIVTNLGDPVVENVLVTWAEAPTFGGAITNGEVAGGVLEAVTSDKFYGDDNQPFYDADGAVFYPPTSYAQMVYEWSQTPQAAGALVLQYAVAASDYAIEYLRDSQAAFYGANSNQFWGASSEPFYGAPGQWQTWPGELQLFDAEQIRWRITTAAGSTRGQISQATLVLDVPDISEKVDDVVISPAGTRLPLVNSYRVISNVQVTVQADGNGGVTARIEDKDALLGPLITVRDAAGNAVVGLVDADIQGY